MFVGDFGRASFAGLPLVIVIAYFFKFVVAVLHFASHPALGVKAFFAVVKLGNNVTANATYDMGAQAYDEMSDLLPDYIR